MGLTFVTAEVSSQADGKDREKVRFLVDTGAGMTMVPARILKRLGIPKLWRDTLELAGGKKIRRWVGPANIHIGKWMCPTLVVFASGRFQPLLGAVVLESLNLEVDPKRRRLKRRGKPILMCAATPQIRIDPTPNPNCLKVSVAQVLAPDKPVTYSNAAAAAGSPIAQALFAIPGVASVFIFKNYCTITKGPDAEWGVLEAPIEAAFKKVFGL